MKFVIPFKNLSIKDVPQVGGKNASLGEMFNQLTKKGIRIPDGFATTAEAYWYFLEHGGLKSKIRKILKGLDIKNVRDLVKRGKKIRQLILKTPLSKEFERAVLDAYRQLSKKYQTKNVDVAVRSSATAEDLPSASFAGQQESYLNIRGEKQLLEAVHKCIASLFTDRAIVYRQEQGFDHLKVALSVGVQKMVRSDLACSGVMFSCDTESGFADITVINSAWGLGENIVQGKVTPDEFMVYEPLLIKGYRPIISKKLGAKEWMLVYGKRGQKSTINLRTPTNKREKFTLSDKEILELAKYSVIIEKHYHRAMDIEWAKDGKDGKLYILQARPETIQSRRSLDVLEEYILEGKEKSRALARGKKIAKKFKILARGVAVGSKIGQGQANVIRDVKEIRKFKPGQVLITEMTDPDWVPVMKMASAIVTDAGGRTCHAAIVSRELGIPCVVGTGNATSKIHLGQKVTVSCAEGEEGYVYDGLLPFKIKKISLKHLRRPKTKIMMNVGEPEQAFAFSFIPNDGVGLAREEFIINNYIKIHPLALLNYKNLKDKKVKTQIDEITRGYPDPEKSKDRGAGKVQFYVDKLAEGIARIAAAFYPKDVIVRFSDFKTNEYANLIGGSLFEPTEPNPMIGWRGASRYYDPKFRQAFDLECLAIKKVRNIFGLDNIIVMVPFCRTVDEGKNVLKILDQHGLRKKQKGLKPLKVYVMCEIPSNVILAEEFCKIFDGFSIGSNDLTQLTLGLDRDSSLVAHLFNERNEAVKRMVRQIIKVAHQYKKKVGICGQAPSDFPEFAKFLIKEGIDSISLNPDTVIKTTLVISKTEKRKRQV
ncbi:MAG: phosphoenolpyruvate synthase [Patescibacteria group bacterium]